MAGARAGAGAAKAGCPTTGAKTEELKAVGMSEIGGEWVDMHPQLRVTGTSLMGESVLLSEMRA